MRCITELFNKQNKQKMSKTILLGKKKPEYGRISIIHNVQVKS